jgi:hypothetical protein
MMKTASNLRVFALRIPHATMALAGMALACAPALLAAQQAPYGATGSPYAPPSLLYNDAQPQPNYAQPSPQQPYAAPYPNQGQAQPAAQALGADQLEQLLAPIALYPDALLAQILTASTYPAQVAVADQWLGQMRAQGYGSPEQIAAGADAHGDWDPSVKALTAFPDVLEMLNHNLEWTTALGNAYYNQPGDVMQTVQVLRERAQQAGNLQSTPQEDVTENQGYIDIAPPDPEVVYVPSYDPWEVYGATIAPYPGFSLVGPLGAFWGGPPIRYGLWFALGAFERTTFGWPAWGFDWIGHAVLFHHSGYFTASASVRDRGLPRGGPRAYNGWRANGRAPGNFNRPYSAPQNGYARGQAYGNRAAAQNYAYRPQAYPNRAQTYANPAYASRQQSYGNRGYGYGFTSRPAQGYATRPGNAYGNSYSPYRAPQTSPRGYSGRSNQMARNDSGGFRGFATQKQPAFRAPKFSNSAPRSYGGGHAQAPRAPKMSRSNGGGRRR